MEDELLGILEDPEKYSKTQVEIAAGMINAVRATRLQERFGKDISDYVFLNPEEESNIRVLARIPESHILVGSISAIPEISYHETWSTPQLEKDHQEIISIVDILDEINLCDHLDSENMLMYHASKNRINAALFNEHLEDPKGILYELFIKDFVFTLSLYSDYIDPEIGKHIPEELLRHYHDVQDITEPSFDENKLVELLEDRGMHKKMAQRYLDVQFEKHWKKPLEDIAETSENIQAFYDAFKIRYSGPMEFFDEISGRK